MRGAWIEIELKLIESEFKGSLPMRGAWIEIIESGGYGVAGVVAPHAGSVD